MDHDTVTVELDLVYYPNDDETPESVAQSMASASGRDLEWKIVEREGPGGGWPRVHFTGPRATVQSMLSEHGFDEDIEVYITGGLEW